MREREIEMGGREKRKREGEEDTKEACTIDIVYVTQERA